MVKHIERTMQNKYQVQVKEIKNDKEINTVNRFAEMYVVYVQLGFASGGVNYE